MISVLFACTGNTCRSPIAAAIARQYVKLHQLPMAVSSAGIHAQNDDAISPQAEQSLRNIGIAEPHASQNLSRDILETSDVIFVMESWQANAIADKLDGFCLENPPRVLMLDTQGDIADPLGHGQQVYDQLTQQMLGLIPARLTELAGTTQPDA